jgi:hypothetical protein
MRPSPSWLAVPVAVAWILTMESGAAVPSPADAAVEEYLYIAAPNNKAAEQEHISMYFSRNDNKLRCATRIETARTLETAMIEMKDDGTFISAVRRLGPIDGGKVGTNKIWRAGDKVLFGRDSTVPEGVVERDIPNATPLAVDASLLVLMRHFPFDTQTTQTVFMADFSGKTVSVLLHDAGLENISVPAGDFQCHRMEVIVDTFLIKPRITYWLSVAGPHFLVKHSGKRGPFTPAYTTSLVRIGKTGDSN